MRQTRIKFYLAECGGGINPGDDRASLAEPSSITAAACCLLLTQPDSGKCVLAGGAGLRGAARHPAHCRMESSSFTRSEKRTRSLSGSNPALEHQTGTKCQSLSREGSYP